MIIENQKMHCVHGFIINQENKAVNNKTSELVSNTLIDRLQFETDNMNEWMLEAKLEPNKWANLIKNKQL